MSNQASTLATLMALMALHHSMTAVDGSLAFGIEDPREASLHRRQRRSRRHESTF